MMDGKEYVAHDGWVISLESMCAVSLVEIKLTSVEEPG